MTTHLSVRLAWHDRGWDAHVCDAPHLNAHRIVHQHIRDSRDDEKERQHAGEAFAELDGWLYCTPFFGSSQESVHQSWLRQVSQAVI